SLICNALAILLAVPNGSKAMGRFFHFPLNISLAISLTVPSPPATTIKSMSGSTSCQPFFVEEYLQLYPYDSIRAMISSLVYFLSPDSGLWNTRTTFIKLIFDYKALIKLYHLLLLARKSQ